MKSNFEPMNPMNFAENIYNESPNSSTKKFSSRNPGNKVNYFIDTNYISNQSITKSYLSFDKNKKGNKLNEKYNAKISNQFNNKKFTNNIINYCLINQNQSPNRQNKENNFFYNIENDLLFNEDQKSFPKPEPTPLKIDKSTKYINISKYFDMNNKNFENERNNVDIKLVTFLQNINLENFLNVFKNNYINFKDLFLLTKEDFIEMKIPIGPRNKLIYYIEQYRKNMKNYEIEDILIFFKYNNVKYMEMLSSSTNSTFNNDYSNFKKANNNSLFFSNSTTQRVFNSNNEKIRNVNNDNDNDIIKNKLDTSLKRNNSNNIKLTKDKNTNKIANKNNFHIYNYKLYLSNNSSINKLKKNNSMIGSKIAKNPHQKKSFNKSQSFIISNKFNNKSKRDKYSKSFFNIYVFNRNYQAKNNYSKKPLNTNIQNISANKIDTQKIYKENYNYNLDTSKIIINDLNSPFLNNQKKTTNIKPKRKIRTSKSLELKENLNEDNLIEKFKNLSSEVEKFENRYKRMKKDSCERKKKIKVLLTKNRVPSESIKLLKQQLNEIDNINSQDFDISNNIINNNKGNENDIQYQNVDINKNNFQNRKENTFFYELNINNI